NVGTATGIINKANAPFVLKSLFVNCFSKSASIIRHERSAVSPVVIGRMFTPKMARTPPNVPSVEILISLSTQAGPPASSESNYTLVHPNKDIPSADQIHVMIPSQLIATSTTFLYSRAIIELFLLRNPKCITYDIVIINIDQMGNSSGCRLLNVKYGIG